MSGETGERRDWCFYVAGIPVALQNINKLYPRKFLLFLSTANRL